MDSIQLIQLLVVFSLFMISSTIESKYFYNHPASFFIFKIYAIVGVFFSALIEPQPFLLGRLVIFYMYYSAKVFSNENLGFNTINDYHIPLSVFPILHVISNFIFCRKERNVAMLFLFFWSHLFFFMNYMAPKTKVRRILSAPEWLDDYIANFFTIDEYEE